MFDEPKAMDYRRSNMEFGQIQLGAKKGSGKSLDRVPSQGFFYGGGLQKVVSIAGLFQVSASKGAPYTPHNNHRLEVDYTPKSNPARQHLIFYDNPSQKRVARCTNIPHTGALPTVKGVEQRLRKGFQSGGVVWTLQILLRMGCRWEPNRNLHKSILPTFESLSSAAEIRHPARNTRL